MKKTLIGIACLIFSTIVFIAGMVFLSPSPGKVTALYETAPSKYKGDSVDDIAVWVHPEKPNESLIVGTLKRSNVNPPLPTGLVLYTMKGEEIYSLDDGTPNNVDIRAGFTWQGKDIQLIIASHWYDNRVGFYKISDESPVLTSLLDDRMETDMSNIRGLCMYRNADEFYFFLVSLDGLIQQYSVFESDGAISARSVRKIELHSRAEGCVVDDENHHFYVAEESRGIWRFDARPEYSDPGILIDRISVFGDLYKDIEGLALYSRYDGTGYLIASSQKKGRFVVYERKTGRKIGAFTIEAGPYTDAVSYTDGIEAINYNLGADFPRGAFIAHDNENLGSSGQPENQNFKIVPWQTIENLINELMK